MTIPGLGSQPRPILAHAGLFLAGLVAGLAALALCGGAAGRTDYHPDFVRFYPAISPEASYFPTINEMTAIVRARCRREQTLVIVGGNSILLGVWQPAEEVWSAHLQELLGDHYCVVNFAMRGASPVDGGAVIAEVLRREFPHQIYIANEAPFNPLDPIGHEPYRYLFWQAYFRGELIDTAARRAAIGDLLWDEPQRRKIVDAALQALADRALHFEDLWNCLAYTTVNTVPANSLDAIPGLLRPRRTYVDEEPDAYNPAFQANRYSPTVLDAEMRIVRNVTGMYYVRTPQAEWKMPRFHQRDVAENYATAFPASLIPRTMMLVSRSSPFYRRRLTPAESVREEKGFQDAVRVWQAAGYAAMEYGRDYTDDDFGDRTHLSKTGGRKLAESVAPAVRQLAQKLGYPP